MKRITFFLLSLGFLCIPVIHCMEDDRETLEEHMDYVKHLTNHGQLRHMVWAECTRHREQ